MCTQDLDIHCFYLTPFALFPSPSKEGEEVFKRGKVFFDFLSVLLFWALPLYYDMLKPPVFVELCPFGSS